MNKKIEHKKCQYKRINPIIKLFTIISILIISLACSKVSAISYNVNLAPTGRYESSRNGILCITVDNIVKGGSGMNSCNYNSTDYLDKSVLYYRTVNKLDVKSDMFYIQEFYTFTQYNANWIYRDTKAFPNWKVIDISQDWTSNITDYCHRYKPLNNAQTPTTYICDNFAFSDLASENYQIQKWTLILQPIQDGQFWYGYGDYNQGSPIFSMPVGGIMVFGDVKEYRMVGDEIAEAEAKTEEATNEGEQNAGNAETTNEQASTNIFGIVTKVVGVFQNAPNGNCVIPVVASGVDLGNVDLCSGKPPIWGQIVGGVVSIILAYACFRTALFIFQWFISLTAFAQGGGWNKGDNE